MPIPRPYQPRTRAEAIAPLDQVKMACQEDPAYLASVARIIADVLDAANAVTETIPGTTEGRMVRIQNRIMGQMGGRQ